MDVHDGSRKVPWVNEVRGCSALLLPAPSVCCPRSSPDCLSLNLLLLVCILCTSWILSFEPRTGPMPIVHLLVTAHFPCIALCSVYHVVLTRSDASAPQLEWVDGELWGNVWQTECIARIDPKSGLIRGWILLSGLADAARRASKGRHVDVLNGKPDPIP